MAHEVLVLTLKVKMTFRTARCGVHHTTNTNTERCSRGKPYLELIKLQCLRDADQLLHLLHLPNLRVALVNDLFGRKQTG